MSLWSTVSVPNSRPDYSIYCFIMEYILVDYAVWISSKDSDSYAMYDFWTHHNSEKQMTNG